MRRAVQTLCVLAMLVHAAGAAAHPAPFSYLDLRLNTSGVTGTLVVHDLDAAHDLGVTQSESLMDPAIAAKYRDALVALLAPRVSFQFDGRPVEIAWGGIDVVTERQSVRLAFTVRDPVPGRLAIRAYVFPYDPIHQTFINLYEEDAITLQAILDASRQSVEYYAGSTQGRLAVIRTFVLSGIEHILIGPDHILFLIGLLLLGGSLSRLALIVTAFTIGHSITLSLAALDVLSPPAYFIEPLIALTIVVVGADNLLVLRATRKPGTGSVPSAPSVASGVSVPSAASGVSVPSVASGVSAPSAASGVSMPSAADIRAWLAAGFGLIHGFGFAYVLKEFGLPQAALAWSLFAFNVGVEIGQLMIVAVVAGSLMFVRKRNPAAARTIATFGSAAVIVAGVYWFIERVFLT